MIRPVRQLTLLLLMSLLGLLSGCPEPPKAEMDLANQALEAAQAARAADCAAATFRSAQEMMERARLQLKRGQYDEAKTTALAARELAEKAKREAETNPDCLKKPEDAGKEQGPKSDGDAGPVTTDASRGASPLDDPNYELKRVFFPYNEASVTEEAARILADNAEWMKRHPTAKIQVEGHCDERGSVEYNLALGERRAQSVRKYLTDLGVRQSRISIISYGEESPLDPSSTEEAYSQNRRAEFRKR